MQIQEVQETETIQFLKTRLMERDRQISDFEAKNKKMELKHNRDLKEARTAEDRARTLLKDEKNKNDKVSKQLRESQEQVNVLNLRVNQLFKEKEREVNDVKTLYNSMKEQVRKYQRILPTLTFLNEFALRIEEIPPYQDIFIGLKDKIIQLETTTKKFEQYKHNSQQTLKSIRQNQQSMRLKKLQIQKHLNDVISKLQECEFLNSQLKIVQSQLNQKSAELRELYQVENQRYLQLQKSAKEQEAKYQEMQHFYNNQLYNKEDEIRKMVHLEFSRLQSENQSLQSKFEMKQKMYLQQIRILQDEVYYLQGRISQQKTNFQQNYLQIKGQIERMREEVDTQRQAHDELKQRYEQMVRSLIKVSRTNEQLESKLQNQERKIEMYEEKQRRNYSNVSDIQISQFKHMQQTYDDLLDKYNHANNIISKLKQDNSYLQEQAATLRSQIVSKTTPENTHTLELPTQFLQFQSLIKRASNITQTQCENEQTANEDLIKQNQWVEQISQLNQQTKQSKDLIAKLQSQMAKLLDKDRKIEDSLMQQIHANQKLTRQLGTLRKEREKSFEQIIKLKEKNAQLSMLLNQRQKEALVHNGNCQVLTEKVQLFVKNQQKLNYQLKSYISLNQSLKQQLNRIKQAGVQDAAQVKKIKQFKSEGEYKKQLQKLRSDWLIKQNTLNQQLKEQRKLLNELSRDKEKFNLLCLQLSTAKAENNNIQLAYSKLEKQKNTLLNQTASNQEQLQKRQRQILKLTEALGRERKERSLLAIPSLKILAQKDAQQQKQQMIQLCIQLKQKEQRVDNLQRNISDLNQQIQNMKCAQAARLQAIEMQQNYYIQQIIQMKMKCAQSEMKAAESQHLYNLLKRKNSKTHI